MVNSLSQILGNTYISFCSWSFTDSLVINGDEAYVDVQSNLRARRQRLIATLTAAVIATLGVAAIVTLTAARPSPELRSVHALRSRRVPCSVVCSVARHSPESRSVYRSTPFAARPSPESRSVHALRVVCRVVQCVA